MSGREKLIGVVGVAAAAILMSFVPAKEGGVSGGISVPYIDPVGVRTVCYGSIRNIEDRAYTQAECEELLAEELAEHAEGALRCVRPPMTAGQRTAYTSLAFNIGTSAFCGSTAVRRHNAGDHHGACAALTMWDKGTVNGKLTVLPGLVIRRAEERKICEKDLK